MFKQLLVIISILSVSPEAFSGPPINTEVKLNYFGQLEYLSHPEILSLDEVRKLEQKSWKTTSFDRTNFGFDKQHYWFRLPLKNTFSSVTPWFLQSKYPLLDIIDIYLFSGSELVQEFHTGDAFPFQQRPLARPDFVFPLSIKSDAEHLIYLHIQTSSSVQLSLSLQNESSFWQSIAVENAMYAAFYAILISMFFYNAMIYLIIRERSYLYYVLYLGSLTLFMACIHGWAYKIFWPNSPEIHRLSVVMVLGVAIFAGTFFTSSYLHLKTVRPVLDRVIKSFGIISILSSLLALFIPYIFVIQINSSIAFTAALIVMFSTVQGWFRTRNRNVLIFIFSWFTLLLGVLMFSGQKFGLLPVNNITEHAMEIGAVLLFLILPLGLTDKYNSVRKAHIATQKSLLEIQIKANHELDKKVRERTEELEVSNKQLKIWSMTDSLTQLKNRHYFDEHFVTEYRKAYREKSWLSLMIVDIDHFKLINDNYGHQAGDLVLQKVALAIESSVKRPSDAAARYGGEEFTVLLPNTPKSGAYLIAERIRQNIEKLEIGWEGELISVTMSLGLVSCIPASQKAEAALLKQADDFLYHAKRHGRNQVIYEDNIHRGLS